MLFCYLPGLSVPRPTATDPNVWSKTAKKIVTEIVETGDMIVVVVGLMLWQSSSQDCDWDEMKKTPTNITWCGEHRT